MELLEDYVKKSVNSYITFQVQQGQESQVVAGFLHKYGVKGLNPKHSTNEALDKQTFYFIKGILADYVKGRMDLGEKPEAAASELRHYGFHQDLINSVMKFVLPPTVEFKIPHGILYLASFIWVFSIIFFISYTLDQEPGIVIASFLPSMLTLIVYFIAITKFKTSRFVLSFLSVILVIALFLAIVPRLNSNLELPIILILNAGITFMASLFVALFYREA